MASVHHGAAVQSRGMLMLMVTLGISGVRDNSRTYVQLPAGFQDHAGSSQAFAPRRRSRALIPGTPYSATLRISASISSHSDSIVFIGVLVIRFYGDCAPVRHIPPPQARRAELQGTDEVPPLPAES